VPTGLEGLLNLLDGRHESLFSLGAFRSGVLIAIGHAIMSLGGGKGVAGTAHFVLKFRTPPGTGTGETRFFNRK